MGKNTCLFVIAAFACCFGATAADAASDGDIARALEYVRQDLGKDMALPAAADWTQPGENNWDEFGYSVSEAGDVDMDGYGDVIIGARYYNGVAGNNTGKAYVFHGSSGGLLGVPTWTAEGENPNDEFGYSVSTAGDVNGDGHSDVIVGAPEYVSNSADGKAYVFLGSPGGITGSAAMPQWSAVGENPGDRFGCSVCTAGDVDDNGFSDVVVGAEGFAGGPGGTGKAYVFHGSASGITGVPVSAPWSAAGENPNDYFGCSVHTAGDVDGDDYSDIIVGAKYYDGNGGLNTNSGKAYVFHGSATGITGTAAAPAWSSEGENANDEFGRSVCTAGDVNGDGYSDVIVGAPQFINTAANGKAYVMHGSATGVTGSAAAPAWSTTGQNGSDELGISVSTAGDVNGDGYSDVIIGARGYLGGLNAGKAYVCVGSSGGVTGSAASPYWSATGGTNGDEFGFAVSTAADVNGDGFSDILVGARHQNSSMGSVYSYYGSGDGLSGTAASPAWSAVGENTGDDFGVSVATAGDVNGDGYSDVIIGAFSHNSNTGKVYVYHGSTTGIGALVFTKTGASAGDCFGYSVSTAGDVNGDGYSDVIVGAYGYNSNEGAAYVFHGSSSGLSPATAWSTTGGIGGAYFGESVSTAGDVNGDGYSDVAVAAPRNNLVTGKVYCFHGSWAGVTGTSASPAWFSDGENPNDFFGSDVSSAGDVNGDGYSDLLTSAVGNSSYAGKVYCFHGSVTGLTGNAVTPAWSSIGQAANDFFGFSVDTAGDVNCDGFSDAVVGAFAHNPGSGAFTGKAYVFHGSAGGLTGNSGAPAWSAIGESAGDSFGYSVSTAGDVNNDSYSDVMVGAHEYNAGTSRGKAYNFEGSSTGITGTAAAPAWSATGQNDGDEFARVALAGDVNGDGYSDVLVGASPYNTHQGKAYAFQGCDGGGRDIEMAILRDDDSVIQGWSGRGDPDSMVETMLCFSTQTRNDVMLQAQVLDVGKGWWSHPGSIVEAISGLNDTGVTGVNLDQTPSGLQNKTYYYTRCRVVYDNLKEAQNFSPWYYGVAKTGAGLSATPARGFRGWSSTVHR